MEGMSLWFREPERDPALARALRQLEAAAEPANSEALSRRILAAARPRLARVGCPVPRWWEWVSGWIRVAVPVGLAASLAAGLLLRDGVGDTADDGSELGSDSTLVLAAFSEPEAGSALTGYLIAPEATDWLMEQAVDQ
jgi:hypothetical protein